MTLSCNLGLSTSTCNEREKERGGGREGGREGGRGGIKGGYRFYLLQDYQLSHHRQVYYQEEAPVKLVSEGVLEMLFKKGEERTVNFLL